MESKSLHEQVKELERHVRGILSPLDVPVLTRPEQKLINDIKRLLTDVRLDVRDYEFADTRAEQARYAVAGRTRLEQLEHAVLAASEYNLFGAVDVAQTTAYMQKIKTSLR